MAVVWFGLEGRSVGLVCGWIGFGSRVWLGLVRLGEFGCGSVRSVNRNYAPLGFCGLV